MKDDFSPLQQMLYSGRGIMVGVTPQEEMFVGYTLTGRSPSSQARKLVQGEITGVVRTDVTDPEQLKKGSPALLLYPALIPTTRGPIIAGNGVQTRLIYSAYENSDGSQDPGQLMFDAFLHPNFEYDSHEDRWINTTTYEPDAPNNTPRISAFAYQGNVVFHIVRCVHGNPQETVYKFALQPEHGAFLTTYEGFNENPLLAFQGEPRNVQIGSTTADALVETIWDALRGSDSNDYQVSAAVMLQKKAEELETRIINRFS